MEARVAGYRRGQHREPVIGARDRAILLQRRTTRRDEIHPLEPQLVQSLIRDREMADVDRVEGAAEYADPAHSSPARSLHSISRAPMRTVSPSFAPSARNSRSIPVRMSWRWKYAAASGDSQSRPDAS